MRAKHKTCQAQAQRHRATSARLAFGFLVILATLASGCEGLRELVAEDETFVLNVDEVEFRPRNDGSTVVIIDATVKNVGTDSVQLFTDDFVLKDNSGRSWEPPSFGFFRGIFPENLGPGLSMSGSLTFVIPSSASGLSVRLESDLEDGVSNEVELPPPR